MKVIEMKLSRIYHQYLLIEADGLTEDAHDKIDVHEDDCYALCSCYCDETGHLMFNALAIGSAPENCRRGLELKEMLACWSMEETANCRAEIIRPDSAVIEKNVPFLKQAEANTDEDLIQARLDWRLDAVRDAYYPDHILTGIIKNERIHEYTACIEGVYGPFLKCRLMEEAGELHEGDVLYTFPYADEKEHMVRMYAMFTGNALHGEKKQAFERIMHVSDKYGITFNGTSMKS